MGPIQDGINQIIQNALHSSIGLRMGQGLMNQKMIKKYVSSITEEGISAAELYNRQKKAPKVSDKSINKFVKKNPEMAKKLTKGAILVPADKAEDIKKESAELDRETESTMSNLPTYSPVSLESAPVTDSLVKKSQNRIKQIIEFDKRKRMLGGEDINNG